MLDPAFTFTRPHPDPQPATHPPPGETQRKQRWLSQLEARRRKEREPHVLHVADIHQQRTFASMFRTMH